MERRRDQRFVRVDDVATGATPPTLGSGGGELPVGSIYMNATDPTNPATLLGYGTWEAIDPGVWLRAI